jgi:polysaccharide biosynthesis transport protein
MELKELLVTFKRWSWLITIGLVAGLASGYLVSKYIEPVYEASTKLMISREVQEQNPDFAGLNSQQLVQTYVQILNTKPLLDTASERIGSMVDPKQVSVQQVIDTQIIEIRIEDHDPENAALIGNTIVDIIIEQSEEMQTGQYADLESRLSKQLEQLEEKIAAYQTSYDQAYEENYANQLAKVNEQIENVQAEISASQTEIAVLRPEYSQADRILAAEKQARINQLQSQFVVYEQIRANLLILGRPLENRNVEVAPHMQQLQSTLDLYKTMYLTLVEDLEQVRFARLQQTPTIVQIEAATIPEKPVRPIPLLYTSLSGLAGFLLAFCLVFVLEALQTNPNKMRPIVGEPWQLEPPDAETPAGSAEAAPVNSERSVIKVTAEARKIRRARKGA